MGPLQKRDVVHQPRDVSSIRDDETPGEKPDSPSLDVLASDIAPVEGETNREVLGTPAFLGRSAQLRDFEAMP
ncbi:hypothetical protein C1X44_34670, partial [Pseudomonas sp. MPR-AND1A]